MYGWCLKRKDYRLFKLNRMDKLLETDKIFTCKNAPVPNLSSERATPRNIVLKALFDADMKWRLVEEFGTNCYQEQEDGRLLLTQSYNDMDNLTMWMLTFGDKVEVLEPMEVRERLKSIAKSLLKTYGTS